MRGNIIVTAPWGCILQNAVVTGSVTVRKDSYFFARTGSDIRGGIFASVADGVDFEAAIVRGSISISGAEFVDFVTADIRGNAAISATSDEVDIRCSVVRGSVVLSGNVINGDVTCNQVTINIICEDSVDLFFADTTAGGTISEECFTSGGGG